MSELEMRLMPWVPLSALKLPSTDKAEWDAAKLSIWGAVTGREVNVISTAAAWRSGENEGHLGAQRRMFKDPVFVSRSHDLRWKWLIDLWESSLLIRGTPPHDFEEGEEASAAESVFVTLSRWPAFALCSVWSAVDYCHTGSFFYL